jgi:hypothetical protein
METWVLHECALLVLMVARVFFLGGGRLTLGISNFIFFRVNVDVMWVYVVGGNGPVPSCFCGLSEKIKNVL